MIEFFRKLTFYFYMLIFFWTIFLLLGVQFVIDVAYEKEMPLENTGFLLLVLLIIMPIVILNRKYGKTIELFLVKYSKIIVPIMLGIFLIFRLYICYGGFFYTGWDAGVIRDTVINELDMEYDQIWNEYYSWFPNNVFIVWIYKSIIRIADCIGIHSRDFVLVVFQCLIDVCTIWLVYSIILNVFNDRRLAFMTMIISCLYWGMSPWFMIAYSDSTGIFIPVLAIRLNQIYSNTMNRAVKICINILLGFLAMVGFKIKPQLFIAMIAIIIIDTIIATDFKQSWGNHKNYFAKMFLVVVGGLLFVVSYKMLIAPSLKLNIDSNQAVGIQHYLMMGLNVSTDGGYSQDDYDFSHSFSTCQDRNRADLEEAYQRVQSMGIGGLFNHLNRKQLVNYCDGTFAWTGEGNFFSVDPEWAYNSMSDTIDSFIRPEGENWDLFVSYNQMIWIFIVFMLLFVPCFKREELINKNDYSVEIMVLCIVGVTLFELIFEARARYLFCYSPVYTMLSAVGMHNILNVIPQKQ